MLLESIDNVAINVECKAINSALKVPSPFKSFADLGSQTARNL